MNPKELERHELIGLLCRVADAKNKSIVGLHGKIINETKNTLTLEQNNRTKTILKNDAVFEFMLKNKKITISGEKLLKRPEERIKEDETKNKEHWN